MYDSMANSKRREAQKGTSHSVHIYLVSLRTLSLFSLHFVDRENTGELYFLFLAVCVPFFTNRLAGPGVWKLSEMSYILKRGI